MVAAFLVFIKAVVFVPYVKELFKPVKSIGHFDVRAVMRYAVVSLIAKEQDDFRTRKHLRKPSGDHGPVYIV